MLRKEKILGAVSKETGEGSVLTFADLRPSSPAASTTHHVTTTEAPDYVVVTGVEFDPSTKKPEDGFGESHTGSDQGMDFFKVTAFCDVANGEYLQLHHPALCTFVSLFSLLHQIGPQYGLGSE